MLLDPAAFVVLLCTACAPSLALAQAGGAFDGMDFWEPCEAFSNRIHHAQEVLGGDIRFVLSMGIDNTTVGKDTCLHTIPKNVAADALSANAITDAVGVSDVESSTGADLGPSLAAPPLLVPTPAVDCPKGEDPTQRNELRFKDGSPLIQTWREPAQRMWYSLTFRVSGNIYPCGSARWVIGQWKQWNKEKNASPVLAQRFDNGVLHITTQDRNCRCVVAQAPGNFDAVFAAASIGTAEPAQTLTESKPIKCLDSVLSTPAKEELCVPRFPVDLHVFTIGGGTPPALPDPKKGFVTMTYLVKGDDGKDGHHNGLIEIYANGQFIVRVTGEIGYEKSDTLKNSVKFNIGQYRDSIPGRATLSLDRLCVSEAVGDCEPGLQVLSAEN
jgi:hypothetical protein